MRRPPIALVAGIAGSVLLVASYRDGAVWPTALAFVGLWLLVALTLIVGRRR